ncbi:MAG: hypothetical protein ACQEXJ_09445 [Myxococcota bacterium]
MPRAAIRVIPSLLLLLSVQGCATTTDRGPCGPDVVWIDRVEGDRAVLSPAGAPTRSVPLASLPPGAGEGQALRDGRLAPACTEWMRSEVRRRRERLLGMEAHGPP